MMEKIHGQQRVTVAGDKGYDTKDFVAECRNLQVTPHVAQNEGRRGGSAMDGRIRRV
jgi:IS5 family transposase